MLGLLVASLGQGTCWDFWWLVWDRAHVGTYGGYSLGQATCGYFGWLVLDRVHAEIFGGYQGQGQGNKIQPKSGLTVWSSHTTSDNL